MKTFIIGLFSLALLASGAAWGHPLPSAVGGAASGGTCGGGVFAIVVMKNGTLVVKPCPKITHPGSRSGMTPAALAGQAAGVPATLGKITKYKLPSETDPCFEYTIDGISRVFCW